jgi:RNA polymerase sigma-70 factor (ECF subfamily)
MAEGRTDVDGPGPVDGGSDEASDRSLLRRLRTGQADAPTLLYLRYARRLHGLAETQRSPTLARLVDADDIVQSVFRTFFRRAVQGQYDVPEGEEIWKLLLVIALNKIRALSVHHHAAKRDVRLTASGPAFNRVLGAQPARDEAALSVLRMVIDQALEGLPDAQRRMVELRIEGYEVAEIAESVRRSKRSVERVLQEFRGRLDALLREDD